MAKKEIVAALEIHPRLQAALDSNQMSGLDFCALYHDVKPTIDLLLPLIKAIPEIGPVVADTIRLLEKIADAACPV